MDWPIALIVVAIVMSILSWYLNLPGVKGRIGEKAVARTLSRAAQKYQGVSYHDIMLGVGIDSAQIDNILITQKCAYVLEVKNYRGRIYGSETDCNWYQTIKYSNRIKGKRGRNYYKTHIEKNPFYNPVMQNRTHVYKMIKHIPMIQRLPIINIVVFLNYAELMSIKVESRNVHVINLKELHRLIDTNELRRPFMLSPEDLLLLATDINNANTRTKENMKQHVARIRENKNRGNSK